MADASPASVPSPALILNVDDNDANLYAVTRMLRRAGYAVVEAINGLDALAKVAELRPDLVVLDVNLPDIDGFEICRRIKADPATASIPVLHMSASYILSEDRSRGLDEGSDAYLVRPVEPPELIATIRALFRIKAAERQARAAAHQWQATFDAIDQGVCLLDRAGTVVRCNRPAASLLGRDASAIVGHPLTDFVESAGSSAEIDLGGRRVRVAIVPLGDESAPAVSACLLTDLTGRAASERSPHEGPDPR
jgi:DNA-binding response OmpR family regulator